MSAVREVGPGGLGRVHHLGALGVPADDVLGRVIRVVHALGARIAAGGCRFGHRRDFLSPCNSQSDSTVRHAVRVTVRRTDSSAAAPARRRRDPPPGSRAVPRRHTGPPSHHMAPPANARAARGDREPGGPAGGVEAAEEPRTPVRHQREWGAPGHPRRHPPDIHAGIHADIAHRHRGPTLVADIGADIKSPMTSRPVPPDRSSGSRDLRGRAGARGRRPRRRRRRRPHQRSARLAGHAVGCRPVHRGRSTTSG